MGDKTSYVYDRFGRERSRINGIGDCEYTLDYDVLGRVTARTDGEENPARYNAQIEDDLTGLYYLRARYYNTGIGRFTQEDVIYNDGLNLYAYCSSNPVMYENPSGYTCEPKECAENSKSGRTTIPSQQQMQDAVTQWARMEESLANSNRQLDKFNTATVVYDARTGNYYGMNRGVQLSGDTLNLSLESWLPESSLNQYRLGNCAEVDAVNQALNSGANASDLYLYTMI